MTARDRKNQGDQTALVDDPSFYLQRKMGGPASRALNPLSIARAEAALQKVLPNIDDEVMRLVTELQRIIAHGGDNLRDRIWAQAHELRGLAGTTAKVRLGQAADTMCHYLFGADADFQPDPKVLSTIAVITLLAVKDGADSDPMVERLLEDSFKAVQIQRQREGRPAI
jgi:hypothetical protein